MQAAVGRAYVPWVIEAEGQGLTGLPGSGPCRAQLGKGSYRRGVHVHFLLLAIPRIAVHDGEVACVGVALQAGMVSQWMLIPGTWRGSSASSTRSPRRPMSSLKPWQEESKPWFPRSCVPPPKARRVG